MKSLILGIVIVLIGAIVPVTVVVRDIQFKQDCAGYLKQAADANTVELALERTTMALKYIESNNLTDGYTSIFWRTENENVGYWYKNIKACQKELIEANDASQLEKTNVLMKVRESLTDNGKNGTELTIPTGISRYPYNFWFGILFWLSWIIILGGGCVIIFEK